MRWRLLVLVLLPVLAFLAPAGAQAAGSFAAHDHSTPGSSWHVQVDVVPGARRLALVVLYVERCGKTTMFEEDVRVGRDRKFTVGGRGLASWRVSGRVARNAVTGVFRLARDTCETGRTAFAARKGTAPDAGTTRRGPHGSDDHDHDHAHVHDGRGSAHMGGHALGTYPDLAAASDQELDEAEALWFRTAFSAAKRFPSYSAARRLGYERNRSERRGRPVLFHLNSHDKQRDGLVLDPKAPESLVYWLGATGKPVLVGFMYRAPAGPPPAFAGSLLTWHAHLSSTGKLGQTQMTHVWLTDDLRSSLAGCLPVRELEASVERFAFSPPFRQQGGESTPCE